MDSSFVLDFYSSRGTDHRGRSMHGILHDFTDGQLETEHDYIQWLFPHQISSMHMEYAPILTDEDIEAFKRTPSLQLRMIEALDLMLGFYGLARVNDHLSITVVRTTRFADRKEIWFTPDNHNFLRLTRMINSMALVGLDDYARALCRQLWTITQEFPDVVSPETVRYWTRAAAGLA